MTYGRHRFATTQREIMYGSLKNIMQACIIKVLCKIFGNSLETINILFYSLFKLICVLCYDFSGYNNNKMEVLLCVHLKIVCRIAYQK